MGAIKSFGGETEDIIEEPTKKEKPYSEMGQKELNYQLNIAIDNEDWKTAKEISNYLKESLVDKMIPKSKEEIKKTLFDKYGVEYYELEEVIEKLKEQGVDVYLDTRYQTEPIRINGWNITRRSRSGQGWGLGVVVSEKLGKKIINTLDKYFGEFWKNEGENGYEYYTMEKDNLSDFHLSHTDALKLLKKLNDIK